jgi:TPR repeat protein
MWIARSFERGIMGYQKDPVRARDLAAAVMPEVERHAREGDVEAAFLLASALDSGLAVAKDASRAAELYRKACDGGQLAACSNLGERYLEGTGVPKDPGRAAELLRRACNGQAMHSCWALALLYGDGTGVPKDPAGAVELLRKACDGGYMRGCNTLGTSYDKGAGVPKDAVRAVELYRTACDGGHMLGCSNLGWMYHEGLGVAQDAVRAVELFRKACGGEAMQGCTALATMYDSGRAVPKDTEEATRLRRKACDGGLREACTPQPLRAGEEEEPNDHVSQANWIEFGKTYQGTLHQEGDPNDYFAFSTTGVDADFVRVLARVLRFERHYSMFNLAATLFDYETEEEMGEERAIGGQNISRPFRLPPDRKYLLRLSFPEGQGYSCAYEIRLTPEGER